jgi:hypothetical protein
MNAMSDRKFDWKLLTTAALTATLMTLATGAAAAEEEASASTTPEKTAADEARTQDAPLPQVGARSETGRLPIYKPPRAGKPARTVGGGSRGPGNGIPALYALVPDHVGQTASSQPSLFWYVDGAPPAGVHFEFTLLDEEGILPMAETGLTVPARAGIQRIRLADYGIELQPGMEYEWSVSIVVDPEERSKDIVATGWIDAVKRPGDLDSRLASAGSERAAHVFASEGLWYDALTALGDRIEQTPGSTDLNEMRSSLLLQVGLSAVASDPTL